jgi:CheY-like chemotaxis protein
VVAHRILICDDDELELAAFGRTAADVGFDVVDTARHAVELLQLVELHRPDAVLMRNEVQGVSGLEVADELSRREPRIEVVLVTSDTSLERAGVRAGAFAVVARGDVENLERALGAVGEWLGGGERRNGPDRRSGHDRRVAQDWSKVFSERRSGQDRRAAPRRKSDRTRVAATG